MDLAGAFRFSSSLVVVMDAADGSVVDVNPAFESEVGHRRAELIGKRTVELDFWPNLETRARIWAHLRGERCVRGERVIFRTRAGKQRAATLFCEMFDNAGQSQVLAVFQDVRDPDAREEQTSTDPGSYRALFLAAAEGLYRTLPDGGWIDVNPALARMFGYESPAQMLVETGARRAAEFYLDADVAARLHALLNEQGHFENQRTQVRRRDGRTIWISENGRAVRDAGGRVLFYEGSVVDITAHIEAESRLRESERKYRELFQNSVTGMFQSHPDGRLLQANDALARILGYASADTLKAGIRHMTDIYAHPHDRDAMITRLLRDGGLDGAVFVARRSDGSDVSVEISARSVYADDGTLLYIEGTAQDITARLEAERALQLSEARYRTLVEHSQVGVYLMADDHYTYVNQAFAAIFGYEEHELFGADFRVLVPPETRELIEGRYRRQLAGEGNRGDYTVTLMRKNGTRIEVVVSAGEIHMGGKTYTTGTVRDVTSERRSQRQLEHNASHDLLTGLPNRLFFEQQLAQVIVDSRPTGACDYAVLFLDLDGFKLVNDSLGHASGDVLLVHIAESLRTHLGGHCLVARYGGDEFTLLPYGACSRARAEQLAQRVLALLAGSFDVSGHRVFSGASLGVVLGRPEYHSPEQVLRDADTAMYRAKASGKSAYVIFDDAMHSAARARLKIETELRFALERGEFRVFYQPIIDLRSGVVHSCEALVRWMHPERGLLLPADFLGVAEETGTIVAMDWWVLEHTCRNLLRWQRRYPAHARLQAHVNVDERQFAEPDMAGTMREVLRRTGIDPSCLTLEVTETVFRRGRSEAEATLKGLKELGVSLVVDDFGTGYSSLESFATSPFDALKIDHGFVRDMVSNFRHRAIVRTIASFAEDLGIGLIAEGVETPEQASLLRELGCTGAQGHLYAPALPQEALELILDGGLQRGGGSKAGAVA